jgi:ABC-type Na+ efflux pump permease subunit
MKLFNFFKNLSKTIAKVISYLFIILAGILAVLASIFSAFAAIGYICSLFGFLLHTIEPHHFADDYIFTGYIVFLFGVGVGIVSRAIYLVTKEIKNIWENS